jgi:hypothetical protein
MAHILVLSFLVTLGVSDKCVIAKGGASLHESVLIEEVGGLATGPHPVINSVAGGMTNVFNSKAVFKD